MDDSMLDILRCPFCGACLRLLDGPSLDAANGRIANGVLCCQCCAYPVVDGIPYLRTGATAEAAMRLLGEGERDQALFTLLDLDEASQVSFRRILHAPALTFRTALEVLCMDAEGSYLFHRFSDPTYLCSRAVLRAVGQDRGCFARRVLDVGGGTGHLTRTLCEVAGPGVEVLLADVAFWKVWLAKRFVAPGCRPVCCDANQPLPFARDGFSLVVCSDAFHYVWSRRLLAGEMLRLVGASGVVLLTHLHNLLCENESAGMPLSPADYRHLFEGVDARLFKESEVFAGFLEGQLLDLSTYFENDDLGEEPTLILLATRREGMFRVYENGSEGETFRGRLSVNALYRAEGEGESRHLRLRFPSVEYEAEYAACKRYLPEQVPWGEGRQKRLEGGSVDGELRELARRQVLLELPEGYC